MGMFEKFGRGWNLAMASFRILKNNKKLLIFPMLSTLSLLFIMASFITGFYVLGSGSSGIHKPDPVGGYLFLFIFYFFHFAVIIFFNMALIHCTFKILKGEKVTVKDGITFSLSRLELILSWAAVSATVDVILKAIENKHEMVASIVTGIFGMLWSLATFFVVPVLAYENLSIPEAIKRSASLFKKTWGENVSANFGFGFISLGLFLVGFILALLILPYGEYAFVISLVLIWGVIACVTTTVETVFLATVYQYAAGIPGTEINATQFDSLFISKQ